MLKKLTLSDSSLKILGDLVKNCDNQISFEEAFGEKFDVNEKEEDE